MSYRNVYADIERSIWHALYAALTALNRQETETVQDATKIRIYNKVDKRDFKQVNSAFVITKVTDLSDWASTGGAGSYVYVPITSDPNHLNKAPWPKPIKLLYEIRCSTNNLADLRIMELLIQSALADRGVLKVYDATTDTLTAKEYCDMFWSGYVNRDSTDEGYYCRLRNIRFEGFIYPADDAFAPEALITNPSLVIETAN